MRKVQEEVLDFMSQSARSEGELSESEDERSLPLLRWYRLPQAPPSGEVNTNEEV